jgi:hypothetical protein
LFKNAYQRTRLELLGDSRYVLESQGLPEGSEKPSALYPRTPKTRPLGEDNGPGYKAENQQDEKNCLRNRTSLSEQIADFADGVGSQ